MVPELTPEDTDRIIGMAWEDRTPFSAIEFQFGVSEADVITIMRDQMKASSFRMWRARVQDRPTKHVALRDPEMDTFKANRQRAISHNKISKR